MYINKVQIYGRLTRDPELKALPSGSHVINFSVATNRDWKVDGVKKEEVEFHNCVGFGKMAEVIQKWVKKGDKILINGRLKTQGWEDKDSGKKMYRTEVVIEDFMFGDNPKKDGSAKKSSSDTPIEYPDEDLDEINPDDIPF